MSSKVADTMSEILSRVCEQAIDFSTINQTTSLSMLGIDSLSFIQLIVEIEEEFSISIIDDFLHHYEVMTIKQLLNLVQNKIN